MDLTPAHQRLLFAVIVVVLAGLGVYLVLPHVSGGAATARASAAASGTRPPRPAVVADGTPSPPLDGSPSPAPGVDIYRWLPFTQRDLQQAAAVTIRFADDYDTYSYTEPAAAYVARMNGLVTAEFAALLNSQYSAAGLARQRSRQRQVSTGTATIDALRAFGAGSITFVVTVTQQMTDTGGTSRESTQYAITVVDTAAGWRVDDIELASAGNQ